MVLSLLLISFSTYLIWKASASFDLAASYLTRYLNEGIKGPTINAIASSLPELLISFFFLFYIGDIRGFSAGYATIIGSSIFNICVIPTIAFLIIYFERGVTFFPTDKKIIEQDGFFLLVTELVLIIGLYLGGISILLSIILIVVYCIYILIVFLKRGGGSVKVSKMNFNQNTLTHQSTWKNIINVDVASLITRKKQLNTTNALLIFIISLIIISLACKQLVHSSERLSQLLDLNIFFVTFFLAAVASSIPDTVLSIKDAKNGKYKDAFSNAYGSNIFDICIGIGLPVLIYLLINGVDELSTATKSSFSNDIIFTSSILLFLFSLIITFVYWFKSITLKRSVFIILMYVIFLSLIFLISQNSI